MWSAIIIIVLLISLNGIFAMAELAVLSAHKSNLRKLADQGDHKAHLALELSNHPTHFLSTIQIGISLVGLLAGIETGARLTDSVSRGLETLPALAPYSDYLAVPLVLLPLVYVSLVWGELFPKQVALAHPETVARLLAPMITLLSHLVAPIITLLSFSTRTLARIFGLNEHTRKHVSEDEIRALVALGADEGVIEQIERELVAKVFHLGDRRVNALQTPRLQIVWLDINDSSDKIRHKIRHNMHAVFPVCEGEIDKVLGIVHIKDLLTAILSDHELNVRTLIRQVLIVPEQLPAYKLLEQFQQSRIHYGLVTDEFGVISGIITINDVLEALVGDLEEEPGLAPDLLQREDGSWLVDGDYVFENLAKTLNWRLSDDLHNAGFQTLAGFCLYQFEHLPGVGESFIWQNFRFEVLDMEGNRINKILVQAQ